MAVENGGLKLGVASMLPAVDWREEQSDYRGSRKLQMNCREQVCFLLLWSCGHF